MGFGVVRARVWLSNSNSKFVFKFPTRLITAYYSKRALSPPPCGPRAKARHRILCPTNTRENAFLPYFVLQLRKISI